MGAGETAYELCDTRNDGRGGEGEEERERNAS